jgi:preprotein translocase subunit SecG
MKKSTFIIGAVVVLLVVGVVLLSNGGIALADMPRGG